MDHTTSEQLDDPVRKMNRTYRWTRQVYDSTRLYARPGRNRLLNRIADRPAGTVLDVGCGTGRTLRMLHERAPQHALFGIDSSLAMLATARDEFERAGCNDRITLAQERVPELNPKRQFGGNGPFDVIIFSYVTSRLPSWAEALETACSHLASDGRLYVLDVWTPTRLPAPVATLLDWVGLVDVEPRSPFLDRLRRLDEEGRVSCTITPLAQHYAYLATVAPRPDDASPQPATQSAQTARSGSSDESKRLGRTVALPA